jgi:hypothetical protein
MRYRRKGKEICHTTSRSLYWRTWLGLEGHIEMKIKAIKVGRSSVWWDCVDKEECRHLVLSIILSIKDRSRDDDITYNAGTLFPRPFLFSFNHLPQIYFSALFYFLESIYVSNDEDGRLYEPKGDGIFVWNISPLKPSSRWVFGVAVWAVRWWQLCMRVTSLKLLSILQSLLFQLKLLVLKGWKMAGCMSQRVMVYSYGIYLPSNHLQGRIRGCCMSSEVMAILYENCLPPPLFHESWTCLYTKRPRTQTSWRVCQMIVKLNWLCNQDHVTDSPASLSHDLDYINWLYKFIMWQTRRRVCHMILIT